jgi:hypothetical protein
MGTLRQRLQMGREKRIARLPGRGRLADEITIW